MNVKTLKIRYKSMKSTSKNSTYVHVIGSGVDLPFGCISDKVSNEHYVYWNPNGSAISNDPNLRSICRKSKGKNESKFCSKYREFSHNLIDIS